MAAEVPPYPPVELAVRVGARGVERARYEEVGRMSRDAILAALPDDWTFAGKRVLDFGCGAGRTLRHFLDEAQVGEFHGCDIDEPSIAWLEDNFSPPLNVFVNSEKPPLELAGESFDIVWAISVFTHISDYWSAWLVELHRLLRNDGLLIATILGPDRSRELGETHDPRVERGEPIPDIADQVGMNVLRYGQPWDQGGPAVFHSGWWIKEHWGRAFDIVTLRESPQGQGVVVARKRPIEITPPELERIDPSEWREIEALRHNIRQLQYESQTANAWAGPAATGGLD